MGELKDDLFICCWKLRKLFDLIYILFYFPTHSKSHLSILRPVPSFDLFDK